MDTIACNLFYCIINQCFQNLGIQRYIVFKCTCDLNLRLVYNITNIYYIHMYIHTYRYMHIYKINRIYIISIISNVFLIKAGKQDKEIYISINI